jgi:acetyl-CoA carboxylase carboxyltransferase component
VYAVLAHFNVMTRQNAQVFPGGPPVVRAALGQEITKEELGGPDVHVRKSGTVDNLAEDEEDAFHQIRRFLSYLPASVYEMAPRGAPSGVDRSRAAELRRLVPHEPRRPYDARRLIELAVDEGSFFEIAPLYGRARITGLARVDGYPVAVMANDPMRGGMTDVAVGQKVLRLLQLADTFHLPLIDFADEPGLMVGLQSEELGIERAGARLLCAVVDSRAPWLTFVIRRLFGVGGQAHHRPSGMFRRYAWPSASWGSMHIAGGASAAYRREIETADDPEAKRAEIENRLRLLASPFRTAEATGQDIIDPAETRELLIEFVHDAQPILATQLGPPLIPYRP